MAISETDQSRDQGERASHKRFLAAPGGAHCRTKGDGDRLYVGHVPFKKEGEFSGGPCLVDSRKPGVGCSVSFIESGVMRSASKARMIFLSWMALGQDAVVFSLPAPVKPKPLIGMCENMLFNDAGEECRVVFNVPDLVA